MYVETYTFRRSRQCFHSTAWMKGTLDFTRGLSKKRLIAEHLAGGPFFSIDRNSFSA